MISHPLKIFFDHNRIFHYAIIGDKKTGKSSMIRNLFVENSKVYPGSNPNDSENDENAVIPYKPTEKSDVLAFDNLEVLVDDLSKYIPVLIADTSGSNGFTELHVLDKGKKKYPDFFIFLFSLLDHESFENLKNKWIPNVRKILDEGYREMPPFAIVGTFCDLVRDEDRIALHSKYMNMSLELGAFFYYPTCCLNRGGYISPIFNTLFNKFLDGCLNKVNPSLELRKNRIKESTDFEIPLKNGKVRIWKSFLSSSLLTEEEINNLDLTDLELNIHQSNLLDIFTMTERINIPVEFLGDYYIFCKRLKIPHFSIFFLFCLGQASMISNSNSILQYLRVLRSFILRFENDGTKDWFSSEHEFSYKNIKKVEHAFTLGLLLILTECLDGGIDDDFEVTEEIPGSEIMKRYITAFQTNIEELSNMEGENEDEDDDENQEFNLLIGHKDLYGLRYIKKEKNEDDDEIDMKLIYSFRFGSKRMCSNQKINDLKLITSDGGEILTNKTPLAFHSAFFYDLIFNNNNNNNKRDKNNILVIKMPEFVEKEDLEPIVRCFYGNAMNFGNHEISEVLRVVLFIINITKLYGEVIIEEYVMKHYIDKIEDICQNKRKEMERVLREEIGHRFDIGEDMGLLLKLTTEFREKNLVTIFHQAKSMKIIEDVETSVDKNSMKIGENKNLFSETKELVEQDIKDVNSVLDEMISFFD